MVPRDCICIGGGGHFISRPPQKHAGSPLSTEHREKGLLLYLRVQYERVSSNCWCDISVWHEAMRRTYIHDYGTCRSRAPVPVRAVDAQFLRPRHWGGRLRAAKSAQTARRSHLETRPAVSAVPWNWMLMTSRKTAGDFGIQMFENSSLGT